MSPNSSLKSIAEEGSRSPSAVSVAPQSSGPHRATVPAVVTFHARRASLHVACLFHDLCTCEKIDENSKQIVYDGDSNEKKDMLARRRCPCYASSESKLKEGFKREKQ
ncbi:hypothetical protein Gotur_025985, partial [Gossypium turneri]